jgi:hypothetical protein
MNRKSSYRSPQRSPSRRSPSRVHSPSRRSPSRYHGNNYRDNSGLLWAGAATGLLAGAALTNPYRYNYYDPYGPYDPYYNNGYILSDRPRYIGQQPYYLN